MRSDYYTKRAARIERLTERAEDKRAESAQLWGRASQMADGIPLGQPILVGHHSEKRDRRYREKIGRTFERALATERHASDLARRATSAERSTAISSDAPDAVARLREKIHGMQVEQGRMKAQNAALRMKDTAKGDARLRALGWSDATIAKAREPRWPGGPLCGLATFELTNLAANLRRCNQRLAEMERLEARAAAAPVIEHDLGADIRVIENAAENRLQVVFPGKPDERVRAALKSRGFRWAPSEGAWQRQLTGVGEHGRALVERLLREVGALPGGVP